MAYTPINWQTGDTITAEKLNKMDNGWGYESTQLFSETVTTAEQDGMYTAQLTYSGIIDADTITVTFDGTEYTCINLAPSDIPITEYGAPWSDELEKCDFSTYPFTLSSSSRGNELITETAASHTIAVTAQTIVTSSNFDTAANTAMDSTIAAIPAPFQVVIGETTFKEVFDAIVAGKLPFVVYNENVANHPVGIQLVIFAQPTNYTVSTITYSGGSIEVEDFTAASYTGPLS